MQSSERLNPSWPLWAIGISAGVLGTALGAVTIMSYHVAFAEQAEQNASVLRARVAILEVALNRAQPYVMQLEQEQKEAQASLEQASPEAQQPTATQEQPAFTATAPAVTTPTPVTTPPAPAQHARPPASAAVTTSQAVSKPPVAQVAVKPAPVASQHKPPAQPQPAAAAKPATPPAPVTQQPAPVQARPAPTSQPAAVTAEELALAMKNKIEGVTATKAGILRLQPDVVEFTSGRKVRKGEIFPSGEKLLSVDPKTGRVITNMRQLIIFDQ